MGNLQLWLRAQWDRIAGVALIAAGGLLLVIGYWGVSGSPFVAEQLSYVISGGMAGLALVAIGVGLLVCADLHDEWRKLDRIEAAIRGEPVPTPVNGGAPTGVSQDRGPSNHGAYEPSGPAMVAGPTAAVHRFWLGEAPGRTRELSRAVSGVGLAAIGLSAVIAAGGSYGLGLRRKVLARRSHLLRPWLLQSMLTEHSRRWIRPAPADAAIPAWLVVDGQTRYHCPGCSFLAGRTSVRPYEAAADGQRMPCELCQPG